MARYLIALLLAGVAAAQPQAPGGSRKITGMSVVFSVDLPLDVPGAVLQPGTYVLRIKSEPGKTGDFAQLQLWDAGETNVLGEFYAVQSYGEPTPERSILTYYDGTSGRRILKAWNLLSTGYGERIVYSPEQAAELGKLTPDTVLAMALPGAPAVAAPATAETSAERAEPTAPLPASYPKTAGNLALALWVGFTALAAFVVFRIYRTDSSAAQNARNNAVARRAAAAAYRTHQSARAAAAGKHA